MVCAGKPTQKKTIQFEDQTGCHAAESEDRFVRRAPRIDSKLICSFCLPACNYDLRSSNDQDGPARPIPGWVQLKIWFSISAFLSRLKWGAEALLGFDVRFSIPLRNGGQRPSSVLGSSSGLKRGGRGPPLFSGPGLVRSERGGQRPSPSTPSSPGSGKQGGQGPPLSLSWLCFGEGPQKF